MTALLNSFITRSDKLAHYIRYMQQTGITVLPPSVNESSLKFTVENGKVRFGLYALKNVGEAVSGIVDERISNGNYSDFEDFVSRNILILNKSLVESLILSGCFDNMGANRAQLMSIYEMVMEKAQQDNKQKQTGMISLFAQDEAINENMKIKLPNIPEFPIKLKLSYEKDKTGLYISGNPLSDYAQALSAQKENISDILEAQHDNSVAVHYDGRSVSLGGYYQLFKGSHDKKQADYGECPCWKTSLGQLALSSSRGRMLKWKDFWQMMLF